MPLQIEKCNTWGANNEIDELLNHLTSTCTSDKLHFIRLQLWWSL